VPVLTTRDSSAVVRERAPSLAILPVGSIEQHGGHLPLATDLLTVEWVATRVGQALNAFLLPGLPFGTAAEHLGFPGTVSLRPETLAACVTDAVRSLGASGIRDVVVLSGHGGNLILRPAIRQLNLDGGAPRTLLFNVASWTADDPDWRDIEADDRHAGEWETSIVLAIAPDLVRGAATPDFVPSPTVGPMQDQLPMTRLTPDGVWGRPSLASAEKGLLYLERSVAYLIERIPATFRALDGHATPKAAPSGG
jgi:creatinine amidohydrolase